MIKKIISKTKKHWEIREPDQGETDLSGEEKEIAQKMIERGDL